MKYLILVLLSVGCSNSSPASLKGQGQLVLGDVQLSVNRNAHLGLPKSTLEHSDDVLISRSQYVLSYNKDTRLLNWAAWEVRPEDLGSSGRSDSFEVDPALKEAGISAVEPSDYTGSCFDRGHQTPSGDRTASPEVNRKTFYMSNIIPQTAYLNRVLWERLEHETRQVVRTGRTVYVYAGPILGEGHLENGLPVPKANFKVVLDENKEVLFAVVMPNVTSLGTDPLEDREQACADQHGTSPKENDAWKAYQVSLEELEAEAHLELK